MAKVSCAVRLARRSGGDRAYTRVKALADEVEPLILEGERHVRKPLGALRCHAEVYRATTKPATPTLDVLRPAFG